MYVWLIAQGEPSPIDSNNPRLHRTGILFQFLQKEGNTVIWWNSAFNHYTKEHRFGETTSIPLGEKSWLVFLKTRGYKRNISLHRVFDHLDLEREFSQHILKFSVPDIIVSAFPTYGLCKEALNYARKHNIPLLIDYRDKWPEVFFDILPKSLRKISRLPFFPLFNRVNRLFTNADGLIGMSEPFLALAVNKAKREKGPTDIVIPFGYQTSRGNRSLNVNDEAFLDSHKVFKDNTLKIVFFGNIGRMFDFNTVIRAAKSNELQNRNIKFIICGTGEKLDYLKNQTKGYNTLILPGFISANHIVALMKRCHLGLCPYLNNEGFHESIPNKFIEYLSGGLPIITSLKNSYHGKTALTNEIGFSYKSGNAQELVSLLIFLDQNREMLTIYSENAFQFYCNNFKAEIVYKKYVNYLQDVLKQFRIQTP